MLSSLIIHTKPHGATTTSSSSASAGTFMSNMAGAGVFRAWELLSLDAGALGLVGSGFVLL